MTAPRHSLILNGDDDFDFEFETRNPVVYLDAFNGWVREVPGTHTTHGWFRVETIADNARVW